MPRAITSPGDFRESAARASAYMVSAAVGGGGDPLGAGISYCLSAGPEGEEVMRRARGVVVGSLVLGVAGLAAGGLLLYLSGAGRSGQGAGQGGGWPMLLGAAACVVVAIGLFLGQMVVQRRMVLAFVSRRFGGVEWQADVGPIIVSIEDAATHQKLKVMPEDMGLMMLYSDPGCVQIEGLRYRYLIHPQDVVGVAPGGLPGGSEAVTIRYRIGEVTLGVTLFATSLATETRRQLVGGNSLVRRVGRVLGADGAPGIAAEG